MKYYSQFSLPRSARVGVVTVAALLAITAGAPAAFAHETPKAGSRCAMSGMTHFDGGHSYVCTSAGAAAKPRWSAPLAVSSSKITMSDGWAKAATSGMSAAFGVIKNPTGRAIRVIGASSPYSSVLQLHEVVDKDGSMVMQQKAGGFVIPAGGSLALSPGGSHIMFMSITRPIKAGEMIPVVLIASDGALLRVKLMAKVFTGANETYDGGSSGMSGM